jgi:uncharacterized DUF497 family protein
MDYPWDLGKTKSKVKKPGLEFADSTGVFDDPEAITIETRIPKEKSGF